MGEFPSKEHQFKPGWKGGPGRPKGSGITDALRRLMEQANEDGKTGAEVMADVAERAAKTGDFRFWNAIVERLEGKVPDEIQADTTFRVVFEEMRGAEDQGQQEAGRVPESD